MTLDALRFPYSSRFALVLFALMLSACNRPTAKSLEASYTVTRVVDGDTFWARNASIDRLKVRLIGIDAPETRPSQYKDVGYYGEEASEYVTEILLGETVLLEFDVDSVDRYGRTLAYVFLEDGTHLNAKMIELGFAKVLTIPPNVKYSEEFVALQKKARNKNRGLWKRD